MISLEWEGKFFIPELSSLFLVTLPPLSTPRRFIEERTPASVPGNFVLQFFELQFP